MAGPVHDGFPRRHHDVQEELVRIRQEFHHSIAVLLVHLHGRDHRCHFLIEDQGCRNIALMELIAHGDRLGDHGVHRNAAFLPQCTPQGGPQNILHPVQAVHHLLGIRTEPKHLADAFVHRAVSAVPIGLIAHHKNRHICRCNAAHRTDCIDMVAGDKTDLSRIQQCSGPGLILCPALKEHRAHAGSLHRVRHILVADRRPCMQNGLLRPVQLRDHSPSRNIIHKHRLRRNDLRRHGPVRLINVHRILLPKEIQGPDQPEIPPGGRGPVKLHRGAAERFTDLCKALQAHIDDLRFFGKQPKHAVRRFFRPGTAVLLAADLFDLFLYIPADHADRRKAG